MGKKAMYELRVVFLCGAVTGDPKYKKKFAGARETLQRMGCVVLDPTALPEGLQHDAYLQITLQMLRICDGVCVFNDWTNADGARAEIAEAIRLDLPIVRWADFQREYAAVKRELDEISRCIDGRAEF